MIYAFQITPTEVDGNLYWSAESTVLKGCTAQGETLAEVITQLERNEQAWLAAARKRGLEIPKQEAPAASYSGRFTVRLAKSLHRQLALHAARDGVSINQFVSDAIAQRVGYQDGLRQGEKREVEPPSV